eukprot:3314452-Alexandrium_andersonii.AAC.1
MVRGRGDQGLVSLAMAEEGGPEQSHSCLGTPRLVGGVQGLREAARGASAVHHVCHRHNRQPGKHVCSEEGPLHQVAAHRAASG